MKVNKTRVKKADELKETDAIAPIVEAISEPVFTEVELVGDELELKGKHSIYIKGRTPIEFENGKANVLDFIADVLRKEGLVK